MKAVVTGANGGIGRAICGGLLAAGHSVIMVSRPSTGSTPFYEKMIEMYGQEKVSLLLMDLSDTVSIKKGVDTLISSGNKIDILINNAGVLSRTSQTAPNGFEMHAMVNCFGPALFTQGIKPLLHKGSRVVNTMSMSIWWGMIPEKYPYPEGNFTWFKRYSDSKLAFQLLSLQLAREYKVNFITVNCVDPGIVDTNIITLNNWLDPLANFLFRPLLRRPERGAATVLFLALDRSVEGKTGGLYKDKKQRNVAKFESCPGAGNVWEIFTSLIGRVL